MSKTQPEPTRIAAIYARVSSERQRQDETRRFKARPPGCVSWPQSAACCSQTSW